jgi:hypothetical protein
LTAGYILENKKIKTMRNKKRIKVILTGLLGLFFTFNLLAGPGDPKKDSTELKTTVIAPPDSCYPPSCINSWPDPQDHEIYRVLVKIANNTTSVGGWLLNGNVNSSEKYIGTNTNFDFPIRTNGSEAARFTTAKNFGIGTVTPLTKLHVSANDASATIVSDRYETGADGPAGLLGRRANGTATSPTAIISGNEIAHLSARGYHSGGAFGAVTTGAAIFYAAEGFTPTAQGTSFKIETTPKGSITPATNFYLTSEGNAGIGPATDTAKLNVTGTTADQYKYGLIVNSSANAPMFSVRNDGITTAYGSLAVGGGDVNFQNFAFAAGRFAHAYSSYAFAIGSYAAANGSHCIAIMNATTNGYESFAAGNVTSNGTHCFAMGNGITVTGQGSFGFGMNDLSSSGTLAQNYTTSFMGGVVAIGTLTTDPSALLQTESTTQGILPPRMTTTQKLAITSPAEGLHVYDTTLHQGSYFNGTIWVNY